MKKLVSLLVLILVMGFSGKAQQTILVTNATKEFIFKGPYISILEDKGKKLTIEEVTKKEYARQFVENKSSYPYNEHTKSAYWIRFKIKNEATASRRFLLESYAPHTNQWDLYVPDGSGNFQLKKSGLNLFFYDREYVNKNLILDLPLSANQEQIFYVHVLSKNHSSFDYRIKSINYFFFYSVNEYYFLGMYYGVMLIMAIYNLFIFISLREKVYVYYVLYVMSGIFTSLADDGIGYQYVWMYRPEVNSFIGSNVAPLFLLLSFIMYAKEFLHLNQYFPSYAKAINWVTGFYLFYYLLKETILPNSLHFHGFYVLPFLIVYFSAFKVYFHGYKPARYFIVGFGFILMSIIIIKLRSNGTVPGNLFTVYSFNYGLVLEVLILSLALAERVKFAKKEKETALRQRNYAQYRAIKQLRINEELKDKVNKELEQKVLERTKELNVANDELIKTNEKLKEITEKAHQMSLKLDLDNWNLQKQVVNSIRDRLVGQEVSYDEFVKLFPDESSCYRYLVELKWESGFVCRKCRSTEFKTEGAAFQKKCARCGYLESATSHTIFHALKFPIDKAFYILYTCVYNQEKMTLQELSSLLGVHMNTCWKFKQKVQLAIEEYENKNKKKTTHERTRIWEWVVFYQVSTVK